MPQQATAGAATRTAPGRARTGSFVRRARAIPPIVAAFFVGTALLPLIVIVAAAVDLRRPRERRATLRVVAVLWVYLAAETIGLLALGGIWLVRGGWTRAGRVRMLGPTFAVQRAWTRAIWGAFSGAMRLRVRVDGADVVVSSPFVLLVRHASIVDTLLPHVFVANPRGLRLRYVLKRELLSDPCLDVAGNRLPNYFVDREPSDETEAARVGRLARDLREGEGVVIYPEGTRFTPERRARMIERIKDPEAAALARRLEHVLPPRTRGTTAILAQSPGVDVVIMEHRGLERLVMLGDVWRGALLDAPLEIRLRRIPRAEVPDGAREQAHWLVRQWLEIDAWLAEGA